MKVAIVTMRPKIAQKKENLEKMKKYIEKNKADMYIFGELTICGYHVKDELRDIAEWARKTSKTAYNCAIGISGGKDSTFQALYARDKLGLRPLLVNSEPEGITDIGRHNIENLINLGLHTNSDGH